MPISSRVGRPLARINTLEQTALREQSGATISGLLGDGNGNVRVLSDDNSENLGLVWARIYEGINPLTGTVQTSVPFRAINNGIFYPADNMAVRLSKNPVTGLMQVEKNDPDRAQAIGLNLNGLNPQDPAINNHKFADIRNMRTFIPTSNTISSTSISIEPYLYAYNGTIKLAEKGQSDNIDLASYIPTAGNERLVGIAIKASDNSVQIVSGTPRTITGGSWSLSDYQELYDLLDADAMPSDIWRLHNAQTEITMSDRLLDWRQVINVPQNNLDNVLVDANGNIIVDANGYIVYGGS